MKYNIVFPDKMNQLGIRPAPVIGPLRNEFFSGADITDGRIKPHIQDFSFCVRERHLDNPITVAGHRSWLKAIVPPAFTLPINVILPFIMTAYIIGVPCLCLVINHIDGPGMIFYPQPVADVIAFAIHRYRLILLNVVDTNVWF